MDYEKYFNNKKHENFDEIYEDYVNQPNGDLDDYIFSIEIEIKKHSEK